MRWKSLSDAVLYQWLRLQVAAAGSVEHANSWSWLTGYAALWVLTGTLGYSMIEPTGPAGILFVGALSLFFAWLLIVVWKFIFSAPHEMHKQARRVPSDPGAATLPGAVLRSLGDTQETIQSLNQRFGELALIVRQYQRLADAWLHHARRIEGLPDPSRNELWLILATLLEDARSFVPILPANPDDTLVREIGWNHYRYTFSVPMRIAPKVSFPKLPPGISVTVIRSSVIDCEVQFFHMPSYNKEKVSPYQEIITDAEL